ncbi:AraC family transcriptional regulator [Rhizomonospora bruguierae]|uniref:AraC family transcriptional regulator n=1 Tax=Rhizomonospora bruguierae TaxID=1581705 RepID=UPI001BCA6D27|nr:AraC family transcriptional regulator [Micromonospora sp. NBRC 107566]
MSVVTELLTELHTVTRYHRRYELSAPREVAPVPMALFHFVATGRASVHGLGEARRLHAGDLVVVPNGLGHRLRHDPDGERTVLLSGGTAFDPADPAALALLPDLLVVPVGEGWLGPLLAGPEAANLPPHTAAMVPALMDGLVGHAIRVWLLEHPRALRGYAAALRDDHLGRALDSMHRHPTRPWTVASLAAQARLSRSEFAQRFTDQVGSTPMAYLTGLRMRLATDLIVHERLSTAEAAAATGYGSAVAFSRAYKRATGRSAEATRRPRAARSRVAGNLPGA